MPAFGKTFSEYVQFQKPILVLILIVGLARLLLSLAGVPNSTVKWLSVTVVTLLGGLYCAIRVHTSGFGSYRHLLPLLVIQNTLAHTISAGTIAIAIVTGKNNIFSAPEYSGGGDGKTWLHVGAHLVLGIVVFSLVLWLVACLILFITRKLTPPRRAGAPA